MGLDMKQLMTECTRFRNVRLIGVSVLLVFLGFQSNNVDAYDEIQVYDMSINQPGQLALEMHSNYVISGRKTADYAGELPPDGILAFTGEFSYGLTHYIELGLYVPMSINPSTGGSYEDDAKLRVKFLNADTPAFFYGLNIEIGLVPKRYSEQKVGMEIRPIIGHYTGDWLIAFNPNLELHLSGSSQMPDFAPSLKVTHQVINNVHFGFEHYADFGGLNNFAPGQEQGQTTYLVADISKDNYRFHIGIGHGWTAASDTWMLKCILGGIPLGELINPNRW